MAQANVTETFPVGDENNGKTPSKFDKRMKTDTDPTIGTYLIELCPEFSFRMSFGPNPMGFVRSSSATCCMAPGRSSESRERSRKASPEHKSKTQKAITTCSGIGLSGLLGLTCSAERMARAKCPKT